MCVTDPWAHMSFMHSILSLKLGVTALGDEKAGKVKNNGEEGKRRHLWRVRTHWGCG
jgi:hypothetical protein